MRCLLGLALSLPYLLLAPAALADSFFTRTSERPLPEALLNVATACQIGNFPIPNPPFAGAGPRYDVAAFIDPQNGCQDCQPGMELSQITIEIEVPIDCELTLTPYLMTADTSDAACVQPGSVECVGTPVTVNLLTGFHLISLPIACDCADTSFGYFLGVELNGSCIPSVTSAQPGPPDCESQLRVPGEPWFPVGGGITMYGEATCCNSPLPGDSTSWGAVKGLFEN